MNRLPLRGFRGITPVSEPAKITGLRGKKKVFLCRVLGYDLCKVDGRFIRKQWADFIGGHRAAYRFIPKHEIWVDYSIDEWLGYVASHEIIEVLLMRFHHWSYDRAHAAANMLEQELRQDPVATEASYRGFQHILQIWHWHLAERFPYGLDIETTAADVARQIWKYVK